LRLLAVRLLAARLLAALAGNNLACKIVHTYLGKCLHSIYF
jgi:hypothetical protein